ncbi:uncharacterized protein EV422DRAFT_260367 [Fimicolochytrium jonesii]|uniref:uncharacterized protein n=1 Tax=Fimicolochytrium jonesii TaxID=1396493 RepID=UPI0022FEA82B|nr:uncharacterized protein EV422DRAFT_260367 [Fimicolochytrium jonesii]KAI8817009.1 hypothetical protein EV422DRAFT_260367 [Fimicolochytrium jonesii]
MKIKSVLLSLWTFAGLVSAAPADGVWSDVIPLPLSPISGAVSPTGELLMWSGNAPGGWIHNFKDPNGNRTYYSVFSVDDFLGRRPIALQVAFTTEMFCPGTSNLPNGEILVNGGSGPFATIVFDPRTKTFRNTPMMKIARGYQANVVTTGDKVFTVGGSFPRLYGDYWLGNRDGELMDANFQWTVLPAVKGDIIGGMENGSPNPDPQGIYRSDNHAWLFSYKNNVGEDMVFHAGPVTKMHLINTNRNTMVPIGARGTDTYSMNGNAVHYSPSRIFKSGGAIAYGDLASSVGLPTKREAYQIRIDKLPTGGLPFVRPLANMVNPRAFAHSIALPGGQIFIVGGQTNLHLFEDTNGVLAPELYNPATNSYQVLAPMKVARNYHSVALLTKYGTIWVGGGGAFPNACTVPGQAPCSPNVHFNGEVFTPPYLSQGQIRPVIRGVSGVDAPYGKLYKLGTDLTVQATDCSGKCTYELIRIASVTHSTNNDQLRVPLQVKTRAPAGDVMAVWVTDHPFIMSGYYYLFAIGQNGAPSVAATVQLLR